MTKRVVMFFAVVATLIVIQGFRHHWRWNAVGGVWDCRTHEVIDDGCNMAGTCLKCEYTCAPGTEPVLDASNHRCGT